MRGNKSIETNSDTAVASGRRPEAENAKTHKEMQHLDTDGDGPNEEITHRNLGKDEPPGGSKASELEESAKVNIPVQHKADEIENAVPNTKRKPPKTVAEQHAKEAK